MGFIGAGCIGAPMIERLVENGHEVRALARSPEKPTAITGWGAQPATTLADVADGGSTATFGSAMGDIVAKDVAVIRETVADLGVDNDRLDDIANSGLSDLSSNHRKVP